MFDLNYYNELNELITLELQQETEFNQVRQTRVHHTPEREKKWMDDYLRFRHLQLKHYDYFHWLYHNSILQNRTRQNRYELVGERASPLSYRQIIRSL